MTVTEIVFHVLTILKYGNSAGLLHQEILTEECWQKLNISNSNDKIERPRPASSIVIGSIIMPIVV